MVSQILDFEASFGPPYRHKSGCYGLRVKCPFGKKLGSENGDRAAISSCSRTLGPSLWEMVWLDHCLVSSFMKESLVSYNLYKEKNNKKP